MLPNIMHYCHPGVLFFAFMFCPPSFSGGSAKVIFLAARFFVLNSWFQASQYKSHKLFGLVPNSWYLVPHEVHPTSRSA